MDVEEHGVNGLPFQNPQSLAPGRGSMDSADARILPQQESELLHGRQFVVSDEHVDHD